MEHISMCLCPFNTPSSFPSLGFHNLQLGAIPKCLQVVKLDFQAPEGSISTAESGEPHIVILLWLYCQRPPHPASSTDHPSVLYLDLSQPESQ